MEEKLAVREGQVIETTRQITYLDGEVCTTVWYEEVVSLRQDTMTLRHLGEIEPSGQAWRSDRNYQDIIPYSQVKFCLRGDTSWSSTETVTKKVIAHSEVPAFLATLKPIHSV